MEGNPRWRRNVVRLATAIVMAAMPLVATASGPAWAYPPPEEEGEPPTKQEDQTDVTDEGNVVGGTTGGSIVVVVTPTPRPISPGGRTGAPGTRSTPAPTPAATPAVSLPPAVDGDDLSDTADTGMLAGGAGIGVAGPPLWMLLALAFLLLCGGGLLAAPVRLPIPVPIPGDGGPEGPPGGETEGPQPGGEEPGPGEKEEPPPDKDDPWINVKPETTPEPGDVWIKPIKPRPAPGSSGSKKWYYDTLDEIKELNEIQMRDRDLFFRDRREWTRIENERVQRWRQIAEYLDEFQQRFSLFKPSTWFVVW